MKITAPISAVSEVEMLLHYGAEELYCGIQIPEWSQHFGNHSWMNRRDPSGANLGSWQEIREVAERARDVQVPLHVTLNAPFYTPAGIDLLLGIAEKLAHEIRVSSLIVSDLNLIRQLSQIDLPVALHLSSMATCINAHAVGFFGSLGVTRIILPRQLTLPEIEAIVLAGGDEVGFEVFALNDGCFYEEGFCQTNHALGGPFCLTEWEMVPDDGTLSSAETDRIEEAAREYLWYQNNCGSSFQEDGLPNGPCSLCWFGHFRDWGIEAVKIVGREASFYRKMRSLQLAKRVMDDVEAGASHDRIARLARDLRNTPEYCDKGYMCYFR